MIPSGFDSPDLISKVASDMQDPYDKVVRHDGKSAEDLEEEEDVNMI